MSASIRVRGCLGCRNFPRVCPEPRSTAAGCGRYESLLEWYRRQLAWIDKAERDGLATLLLSGLIVAAVALLTQMV